MCFWYLRTTSRPGEVSVEINYREACARNLGFGHMKHALRFVVFKRKLSLAGRLPSTELTFLWSHLPGVDDYALSGSSYIQRRQLVFTSPSIDLALLSLPCDPSDQDRDVVVA